MSVAIVALVLLLIAVVLLGIRVFFVKDGKFPNTHIGSNKAMREKGIACATSQDREAQKDTRQLSTADIIKQITENK